MGFFQACLLCLFCFMFQQWEVNSQSCVTETPMTFKEITGGSKCFGGVANPGYFYEIGTTDPDKFIIWLGDSDLCEDLTSCETMCDSANCDPASTDKNAALSEDLVKCYFTQQNCNAADWSGLSPRAETILCGSAEGPFSTYTRVFIPQCSFDWFLGTESGSLHNGGTILIELLNDMASEINIAGATKVVVGGTRGGGIGALNQLSNIESTISGLGATNPTMLAVVDSAWYLNLPEFALNEFNNPDLVYTLYTELLQVSQNWIANAQLDPLCKARWSAPGVDLVNCLFPYELVDNSAYLDNAKIFFSQSQYDLLMLSQYGVSDEEKGPKFSKFFEDDKSYASNVLQYIEQFGATMRSSIEQSAFIGGDNHFWFSTSCDQHGTIVPTDFHELPTRTEAVQEAGSLTYSRSPNYWNQVTVDGLSLKQALTLWVTADGNQGAPVLPGDVPGKFREGQRVDRCNSFHCNHDPVIFPDSNGGTCTSVVNPFVLSVETGPGGQTIILLVACGIIASGWLSFVLIYTRVLAFRGSYKYQWKKLLRSMQNTSVEEIEGEIEELVKSRRRVITLMVTNLSYYAPPRVRGANEYQILNRVSIAAKAGEVHAIMGPAGCGKSTLLDLLAYTRTTGRMRGNHYINGVPSHLPRAKFLREWLRNNVSYVRQKDFLFPHLTVKEHLTHAAWLMLPQNMKAKDKIRRIYLVAKVLNIEQTLDTKCGDGGVRVEGGISGGQRRRVSVATQLLKLPAALILDEPTSGLDSANALAVVQVLHNLAAKSNVNVLMTIHQPRREIFNLFHRLTILNKGSVTFSGSPVQATRFFNIKNVGANIGNDILDKLKRIEDNPRQLTHVQHIFSSGALGREVNAVIESEKTDLNLQLAKKLKSTLIKDGKKEGRKSWTKPTGYAVTAKVLVSRTILRGGFDIVRTCLTALLGGTLVGLVFLDNNSYSGSTALAYLIIASMAFLQSTFLGDRYQLEKGMWSHEKDNGTVVSWVAFLTSLFLRNIVSSTLEGISFAIPAYWMGKLNPDLDRFLLFVLLLVLVSITVIAQNTFVEIDRIRMGGAGPDVRDAAIVNMFFISVGALFNGFIIQLKDIPTYLGWVPYCMLTFWGFVGILVNNFLDFRYPCDISTLECAQRTGDNFVREFQYDDFNVYQCILALCGILAVFHVLSVFDFWFRFVRKGSTLTREDSGSKGESPIPQGKIGKSMAVLMQDPGALASVDVNVTKNLSDNAFYTKPHPNISASPMNARPKRPPKNAKTPKSFNLSVPSDSMV